MWLLIDWFCKSSMISNHNLYFGVHTMPYNMIDYANYPTISFMLMSLFFVITFQKVAKHPFLLLPFCKESSRQHWWCQLSHSLFSCWSQNQVLKNYMFLKLKLLKNTIFFSVETNLIIFSWDTLLHYNQINHFGKENYWNIYLSGSCIFQSLIEMNENV